MHPSKSTVPHSKHSSCFYRSFVNSHWFPWIMIDYGLCSIDILLSWTYISLGCVWIAVDYSGLHLIICCDHQQMSASLLWFALVYGGNHSLIGIFTLAFAHIIGIFSIGWVWFITLWGIHMVWIAMTYIILLPFTAALHWDWYYLAAVKRTTFYSNVLSLS